MHRPALALALLTTGLIGCSAPASDLLDSRALGEALSLLPAGVDREGVVMPPGAGGIELDVRLELVTRHEATLLWSLVRADVTFLTRLQESA